MNSARRIQVTGEVQGVGFRPFVWRLARELDLQGWVRNGPGGVEIAAEGGTDRVEALLARIRGEAPPLARIESVRDWGVPSLGALGFRIEASEAGAPARTAIGPDTAPCEDCLGELFHPGGRRWRHPFITCTQCGPRFTLTHRLPYDRAQTSMAGFALCARCSAEYLDPADRRFHAEPTCCPHCGPSLWLERGGRRMLEHADPVHGALSLLQQGAILAIKGLGGFHLACDARNADAVARLRERKNREAKPLAVMGAGLASLEDIAQPGPAERELLRSAARPVVLCPWSPGRLAGIAPGLARVGLLLPSTPIQYLLFHEAAGRPSGIGWLEEPQPLLLVMTSANPGGEPIVAGNAEAQERLAGIADALLVHDRGIVMRCDDSVRSARGFVRRARGYVPRRIGLSRDGPSVLALGGSLKVASCLARGDEAFVSQHVGDLDNAATCRFLEESVHHLEEVLEAVPEAIACDLHPDFHSTRLARRLASERGIPLLTVQHHHAHIGSVLAEHRFEGQALGLALDGFGLGGDGGAWGGELLHVQRARCERLGHVRELALPGGDRAAREPWRMAASALFALGRGDEIERRFADEPGARTVHDMLRRQVNSAPTSSMGRYFDAAAGLLGVAGVSRYEGEAAMRLEALAGGADAGAAREDGWRIDARGMLDLLPLLAILADEKDAARGAATFHATLAQALAEWAAWGAHRAGADAIAAAGGCLLNARLAADLGAQLRARGMLLLEARELPPNDGGLALGQAWVARHRLEH